MSASKASHGEIGQFTQMLVNSLRARTFRKRCPREGKFSKAVAFWELLLNFWGIQGWVNYKAGVQRQSNRCDKEPDRKMNISVLWTEC